MNLFFKIGDVLVKFKWFPMNSCKVCQLKLHDQLIFELFVLISNACFNCFLTRERCFCFRSWLKPLIGFKCAVLFLRCSEKLFFFTTLVTVTYLSTWSLIKADDPTTSCFLWSEKKQKTKVTSPLHSHPKALNPHFYTVFFF